MKTQDTKRTRFTPIVGGLMLQRKCACGQYTGGSPCAACNGKKRTLQRHAVSQSDSAGVPPIVHDTLRSQGQQLDATTRALMQARFDHDFSHVRVHTDARAAESAQAVNALAYTVGSDMVFGAGQYSPATPSGKRLLAHELTHVLQQEGAAHTQPETLELDAPGDAYEREADTVAAQALAGAGADVRGISKLSLRRMQRQRRQDTHAGMFEMTRHTPLGGPTFSPQAQYDVRIEFFPFPVVNCKEIAFTQTLVPRLGAAFVHPNVEQSRRALTAAEGTPGVSIDRMTGRTQPFYGADNPGTAAANTHFGSRVSGHAPDRAWMTDLPGYPGTGGVNRPAGVAWSQHFETCAICKRGTDVNAYYGCVSWGYDVDATDHFIEAPFRQVSRGTPSTDFLAAARKWNAQAAPATVDLPIPGHATRNTNMRLADIISEISTLQTRLTGLAPGHADIPQITFELRVLRDFRDAIYFNENLNLRGSEIRKIQRLVGAPQDGFWNYETVRRIKLWQALRNLPADGRATPATLATMRIVPVGVRPMGDFPLPDTSPTATRAV